MVLFTLEMPPELHGKLKALALLSGQPMKQMICDWVRELPDPGFVVPARDSNRRGKGKGAAVKATETGDGG